MIYIVIRNDKPGADPFRQEVKPAHRAFLTALGVRLLSAGAIFDEANNVVGGSIMFEADDLKQAEEIAYQDPYATHPSIAATNTILPFRMRWKDGKFYGEDGFSPTGKL